jgi:hypothetical protein
MGEDEHVTLKGGLTRSDVVDAVLQADDSFWQWPLNV